MRRLLVALAITVVGLLTTSLALAFTVQEAILRAKPGVALVTTEVQAEVTMDCGQGPVTVNPAPFIETGTGWLVDGRGFVITNAHVVDPAYRMPPWVTYELKKNAVEQGCVQPALRARGLMPGQRPDVEEQIRRDATARALGAATITPTPQITVLLSNGKKLPAEVKKFSAPLGIDAAGRPFPDSGRDLALLRIAPGVYPALGISRTEPQIGDPVHILGFPGVVLSHELLSHKAALDASVTNGAISGFKPDAIGQDVVQTDAPAAHGNSGGPAVGNDANVIGVLTFVSLSPSGGAIVQGFNFLIPAKDVLKFLQGTEVHPGESPFNTMWDEALTAFFSERYPTALAKLREANRLVPDLTDVKRALGEAEEKVKHPPPQPFPWAWVALGVTFVSAGGFGTIGARRWWKNRHRVLPAQVVRYLESGVNPILLDVRTQADYETSPLTLPGAVRLAPEDAEAGRIDLTTDPGQLIVAYCTSPEEQCSAHVAVILRKRGFRNVKVLKGGLGGWTNARLPVEAKSHLPSIGLEIYKNLTVGDVERRPFKPSEVIFRQGDDAGGEAYVVHAGTVEIRRHFDDGSNRVLGHLHEGDLFGEMALFRRAPRSADAMAESDVELLVIKNERLEWLIRNRPQLTIEILKRLSDWVVQTDAAREHQSRSGAAPASAVAPNGPVVTPAGGSSQGGEVHDGPGPRGDDQGAPRWNAARKAQVVLRLLQGEPLDEVAREVGVPSRDLDEWRRTFLDGATWGLRSRDDAEERALALAWAKIGELVTRLEQAEHLMEEKGLGDEWKRQQW